jgi:hypothetical protein
MAAAPSVPAAALAAAAAAMPALAAPESCTARVHWNAVEHSARDLGHGRVAWVWSWSLEGVADDLHVADCASGEGLVARARAHGMSEEIPYDRREDAARVVAREAAAAPAFFTFPRLAAALEAERVPTRPIVHEREPCACALHYPEMRGTRLPWEPPDAALPPLARRAPDTTERHRQ